MIRGLYTASAGMNVQMKKMDIISNDLANVNTTGYKKDTTVIASFPEILTNRLNDMQNHVSNDGQIGKMSLGAKVDEVYTNFIQGSVVKTSGIVDAAIQGEGFFAVQTPAGLAYTRDGNFSINQAGQVVTKEGYNVLTQSGTPLEFGEDFMSTPGEVVIKQNGGVYRGGAFVDNLALIDFEDKKSLKKLDDNLYQGGGQMKPFGGSVLQGYLEASNVNPVTAMVDMITVSRAYEANQKVVQTQDSLLDKAVNDLGRA